MTTATPYDPSADPFEGIDVAVDERVVTITIDRPAVYNAITVGHMMHINGVCQWAETNEAVRCVVITGTGSAFCTGADLGGMDVGAADTPPPIDSSDADLYGPLMQLNKPTIAAVNGVAAGGGLGIALCCDVRIASDRARFATSFLRIGVVANDTVPWLLPRLIGQSRALEMIYDPRPVDATWAAEAGLVNRVVPHEELRDNVTELALRWASGPPYAVRHSKRLVLEAAGRSYRDFVMLQEYAHLATRTAAAGDIAEGVAAFMEKRAPNFAGADKLRTT